MTQHMIYHKFINEQIIFDQEHKTSEGMNKTKGLIKLHFRKRITRSVFLKCIYIYLTNVYLFLSRKSLVPPQSHQRRSCQKTEAPG